MNSPTVLHVSFSSRAGRGVVNQLMGEYNAAKAINIPWEVALCTTTTYQESFIHRIPLPFSRNYILKRIYFHFWLLNKLRRGKYDILIFRYIKGDLFSFFLKTLYKKRFTIHHSKELEELQISKSPFNQFLLLIESYLGSKFIGASSGIIGMTEEIAKYELNRAKVDLPYYIYPNAVDANMIDIVPERRESNVNVVFIAGSFMPWHGLDLLLDEIETAKSDPAFVLHLIGNVPEKFLRKICNNEKFNKLIELHGYLTRDKIIPILAKCDVGIASLALQRVGLTEGCVLKVREYLASGLPVFSGYPDSGLPSIFPYYRVDKINLDSMISYAREMKAIKRSQVRDASMQYIDKTVLLDKLYKFLVKNISN